MSEIGDAGNESGDMEPEGTYNDPDLTDDLGPDRTISDTGDIILVVGEPGCELRLRVQSVILKEASPVFRAMLSPPWVEIQGISAENSKEVHLPDDDPHVMESVCEALHFGNNIIIDFMPVSSLLDAAILVEKYDFVRSMKRVTDTWLQISAQRYQHREDAIIYPLSAAWTLNDADSFSRLSWILMVTHSGPYTDFFSYEVFEGILPPRIAGKRAPVWMVD